MATGGTIFESEHALGDDLVLERAELDWLLTSGVLGRSANIARVLKYVCEERFAGRADQIKEYNIAVEALGRRPSFDPQTDTIVRVTVHSLRKRLNDIYQTTGVSRPFRVVMPPGRYVPTFVPVAVPATEAHPPEAKDPVEIVQSRSAQPTIFAPPADPEYHPGNRAKVGRWIGVILTVIVCYTTWASHTHFPKMRGLVHSAGALAPSGPPPDQLRALMGVERKPYTDHSGLTWSFARYCQGGTNTQLSNLRVGGTEDPYLYQSGVRGIAHCIFPVKQGTYEIHLHFAEASDLEAATRPATFSINAGPNIGFDVVSEAGGDGIATSTIVTGVTPENDGAIHLDYISEVSLLNAVEILPEPSGKQVLVRLLAGPASTLDSNKQFWLSDRYFSGGRRGQTPQQARLSNLGMYAFDRIGRFRYNIPAVPFAKYRLRLYFREPWFGRENGGIGGLGSRVFDVACNGNMLLKDFDILREGGSAPVVKTFEGIQASADGRIELSFLPVVNYAVVNAIEVIPED
ncbi:malectin domain-containing carbohydrate-binding protein [Tunturiibacter gelidiferens]|uniref:malectin domain-containing carbohydrate-binding protein n=1 Tax=Tunturiibacter gelidiferens TaxID=3069689 RepID=UPI003D9B66A0